MTDRSGHKTTLWWEFSCYLTLLVLGSWFLVERPALRLKMRGRVPETVQERAAVGVGAN